MININKTIPFRAVAPGEVLKEELNARGIKQSEFARKTNIATSTLNNIIKAKRDITTSMAIAFENTLGIEAEFWLNMQSNYKLNLKRIEERKKKKSSNALSIANWYIDKAKEENKNITLLQLIKLVFITYGYGLALLNKSLIDKRFDKVEAWKFGPVIPNVYYSFKANKKEPIKEKTIIMQKIENDYDFITPTITDTDIIKLLNIVWQDNKNKTVSELINELHQIGTPWAQSYIEGENIEITEKQVADYYTTQLRGI